MSGLLCPDHSLRHAAILLTSSIVCCNRRHNQYYFVSLGICLIRNTNPGAFALSFFDIVTPFSTPENLTF